MCNVSCLTNQNMDILRQKLSLYGVGRRGPNDDFFKNCPVTKVYSEPINLADLYPEDYNLKFKIDDDVTCQVPGCSVISKSIKEYEAHYNLAHRYTCSQCKRRLPTAHLLDLHLSEVHDSFFAVMSAKKPSYCCYVQECDIKSKTPEDRHKHCVEDHKFPADFKYEVLDHKKKKNKKGGKNNLNPPQNSPRSDSEPMDVSNGTTEKKKMKHFNFGHSQTKSFNKPWHARKYSNKNPKEKEHATEKSAPIASVLESDDVMVDLKESLCDIQDVVMEKS